MSDDTYTRETFDHRGFTVKVVKDVYDPLDPRVDYENESTMVCFHRGYTLGDQGHGFDPEDFTGWTELRAHLVRKGAVVILPLYLLDHSGLSMRAGRDFSDCDPGHWDSGMVGYIFQTRTQIKRQWLIPRNRKLTDAEIDRAREGLLAEVKEYNNHLTGNCWGFVVEDAAGVLAASCWGFLGDPEGAASEGRAMAEWLADQRDDEEAQERAEAELPVVLNV